MGDPFEGLFDTTDVLERVGIDLTALARRGDLEPVRCRDAEIARVVDILLRQGKNNPGLVGKAGVGKTAIVEGLAQRIAAGEVPPALKDARILQLDHVALLELDRKSTRLNSSHITISYAVFCLKKKKTKNRTVFLGDNANDDGDALMCVCG